jgi:hypothetical protein
MGQQQLLLIVLGVIIVGIAIVAGIAMFNAGAEESAKDELVSQCVVIGANAQQFYRKPTQMGGGGNTFNTGGITGLGYTIPLKMATTANGIYTAVATAIDVVVTGTPVDPLIYLWHVTTTVTADELTTVVSI